MFVVLIINGEHYIHWRCVQVLWTKEEADRLASEMSLAGHISIVMTVERIDRDGKPALNQGQ